jgi:hypothetical protein
MAIQLDTGGSVSVDLAGPVRHDVPERTGTVVGVITDGSRRVNGTSILRGDSRQSP